MNKRQALPLIAIDGSRAFLKRRTGIEEYSYQVIKHLRNELSEASVVLYIRSDQAVDFDVPSNWRVKKLWAPRLWTQVRLSLEMLLHTPDVLFVPAHTVPLIHPKHTAVVIHGLEYEFCREAYSMWSRVCMRAAIRFSCRVAKTVICVSENTKRDVMRVYGTPKERITVVHEGYENTVGNRRSTKQNQHPYFLFIGRLEERKNIVRLIEAFALAKETYGFSHRLILVGKPGYGYERIKEAIVDRRLALNVMQPDDAEKQPIRNDIVELGYVTDVEKWDLLKNTDGFLFATLYEGFGIPVLEAQYMGAPVITSKTSSLPEVAGEGALLVDPESAQEIAEAMGWLVSDNELKSDIMQKGLENVKRFSWEKCAKEIGVLLKEGGN
ncbi:MAG: glycosyltransferase family 1 protein [Candidatus Moranbacteria bacterium]|nr:glycosyltransferase family 1 protein [Candidatus Moranbacteria bacterium]